MILRNTDNDRRGYFAAQVINALKTIDLQATQAADGAMECIEHFTMLENLNLGQTQITDRGMERISRN